MVIVLKSRFSRGPLCTVPFGNPPPPKRPDDGGTFKRRCPLGTERCGNECCAPGLQCCDLGAGRVGCRETCVA
jgi:hypothetical protein